MGPFEAGEIPSLILIKSNLTLRNRSSDWTHSLFLLRTRTLGVMGRARPEYFLHP